MPQSLLLRNRRDTVHTLARDCAVGSPIAYTRRLVYDRRNSGVNATLTLERRHS
jgi:hypothetical protein